VAAARFEARTVARDAPVRVEDAYCHRVRCCTPPTFVIRPNRVPPREKACDGGGGGERCHDHPHLYSSSQKFCADVCSHFAGAAWRTSSLRICLEKQHRKALCVDARPWLR
jgi:hypothetical protein